MNPMLILFNFRSANTISANTISDVIPFPIDANAIGLNTVWSHYFGVGLLISI